MGLSAKTQSSMNMLMDSLYLALVFIWGWIKTNFVSGQFWLGALFGLMLYVFAHLILIRRKYYTSQVSLNLPFGLGNVVYNTTNHDRILAWKLYVHLKTRKAALMFDEENDVITEIYNSLYELFPITRDLLVDFRYLHISKSQGVPELVLRVLNDGIRPHLTKWQASYRKWWEQASLKTENKEMTPQQIQQQFPSYVDLVKDLKAMNTEMSKYAEELLAIVKPPRRYVKYRRIKRVKPERPTDMSSSGKDNEQLNTVESDDSIKIKHKGEII